MFKNILLRCLLVFFVFSASYASANITSLYLDPSLNTVGLGNEFTMDIVLNNTDLTEFDMALSWISFDPTKLEVKDQDPLTVGIQIQSDPLNIFSFDFHMANAADNLTGKIDFEEGFDSGISNKSGVIGRITFKSLALTASTPIDFDFNTWSFTPTTAVLYGGDVLASSTDHTDGTTGATVAVIPEPGSVLLLGSGLFGIFGFVRKRRS